MDALKYGGSGEADYRRHGKTAKPLPHVRSVAFGVIMVFLLQSTLGKPISFNRMETFNMGYKATEYTVDKTSVNSYYDFVSFYMSYDANKDKSREVSFFPDLNSQNTIMNEIPSWGISCPNTSTAEAPDMTSTCALQSNTSFAGLYRKQTYNYKKASTFLLVTDSKIEFPNITNALEFQLGQELSTPSWLLDGTGVLGLSPADENPIWSYLFKTYAFKSNRFSFALKYKSGEPKAKFNEMNPDAVEGSKFLISDSTNDMPGATTFYLIQRPANGGGVWSLPEVTVSLVMNDGTELPLVVGQKACLTNNYHSLLAASPEVRDKLLKKVAQEMCKKDDCGSEVHLSSAPKMAISINLFDSDTVRYIISPEDYIIPSKSHTNASISDINDWKPVTCPGDYNLAFGKLFFETSYIAFEVYKNGDKRIKLSEYIKIPKATSQEKGVMLLFILVCVFIMTSVTVFKVCKHRQERLYDLTHSLPPEVTMYRSMQGSDLDKEDEMQPNRHS